MDIEDELAAVPPPWSPGQFPACAFSTRSNAATTPENPSHAFTFFILWVNTSRLLSPRSASPSGQ